MSSQFREYSASLMPSALWPTSLCFKERGKAEDFVATSLAVTIVQAEILYNNIMCTKIIKERSERDCADLIEVALTVGSIGEKYDIIVGRTDNIGCISSQIAI